MEVIYSYTDKDAVEDGVLVKIGSKGDRVSNLSGLFNWIEDNGLLVEVAQFIEQNRQEAMRIYEENIGGGIFKWNIKEENLWLIPNENGGLTLMHPEDY